MSTNVKPLQCQENAARFATTRTAWVTQRTNALLAEVEVVMAQIADERRAGILTLTEASAQAQNVLTNAWDQLVDLEQQIVGVA